MRLFVFLIAFAVTTSPAFAAVYGQWSIRAFVDVRDPYRGWSERTLVEFQSTGFYDSGRIYLDYIDDEYSYSEFYDDYSDPGVNTVRTYLSRFEQSSVRGWFSRDQKSLEIDYRYSEDYYFFNGDYDDGQSFTWSFRNGSAVRTWEYDQDSNDTEFAKVRYDIERLSVVPLPGAFWMMSAVALAGVAGAAMRSRREGAGPGR